jgi:hypothetical protein
MLYNLDLSLVYLLYLYVHRPYKSAILNFQAIFNEVIVFLAASNLLLMTRKVKGSMMQTHACAHIYISFCILVIAMNGLLMLFHPLLNFLQFRKQSKNKVKDLQDKESQRVSVAESDMMTKMKTDLNEGKKAEDEDTSRALKPNELKPLVMDINPSFKRSNSVVNLTSYED